MSTPWWGPARTRRPDIRSARALQAAIPMAAVRGPVDVEVVIPAHGESSRLSTTLAAMVAFLAGTTWSSRVVLVDDGSCDDTPAVARALSSDGVEVVVIGCARAGKGASVLGGLRTSCSRYVGFIDAGLSTPPATLVPAVAALEAGAAAAIASRHVPGTTLLGSILLGSILPGTAVTGTTVTGTTDTAQQPPGHRLSGQVFRSVARPLVPGVDDTRCSFALFDSVRARAAIAHCRDTGTAFDVELLRQIHGDGGRIVEIPVTRTDDPDPTARPVRDGFAAIAAVSRMHRRIARADLPGSDAR